METLVVVAANILFQIKRFPSSCPLGTNVFWSESLLLLEWNVYLCRVEKPFDIIPIDETSFAEFLAACHLKTPKQTLR